MAFYRECSFLIDFLISSKSINGYCSSLIFSDFEGHKILRPMDIFPFVFFARTIQVSSFMRSMNIVMEKKTRIYVHTEKRFT